MAEFEIAILDMKVADERINSAAELIDERGIPLTSASGCGRAGTRKSIATRPVTQKPFMIGRLKSAVVVAPRIEIPTLLGASRVLMCFLPHFGLQYATN